MPLHSPQFAGPQHVKKSFALFAFQRYVPAAMAFLYYFCSVLHIVLCLLLVLIVLLQAGKGASVGASFGGSSNTIFGSRGPASFFHYFTTGAATLFVITSVFLAMHPDGPRRASAFETGDVPVEQTGSEDTLEKSGLPGEATSSSEETEVVDEPKAAAEPAKEGEATAPAAAKEKSAEEKQK